MDYHRYTIKTDPETAELLLAFLSDSPFDTFEETPEGLDAYAPVTALAAEIEAQLAELSDQFSFEWEKAHIPGQNWNKLWESNFQPVIVGDFCAVRADFHQPIGGVKWELVINPKMAFGTGHHETTWQCIAAIEHLPMHGARVLDYGCGTGILAILASKQGAIDVEAVDIEEESFRNAVENIAANGVQNVTVRLGTLEDVQGAEFDGILANINRHVILASLSELASRSKQGAWLLVSGILLSDEDVVTKAAHEAGFVLKEMKSRGNWLCGVFVRGG
jgi:ribosomal protein L11 methyltransferase